MSLPRKSIFSFSFDSLRNFHRDWLGLICRVVILSSTGQAYNVGQYTLVRGGLKGIISCPVPRQNPLN